LRKILMSSRFKVLRKSPMWRMSPRKRLRENSSTDLGRNLMNKNKMCKWSYQCLRRGSLSRSVKRTSKKKMLMSGPNS
jgi:hypothetical protein